MTFASWGKNPAGSRYSGVAGGVVIDAYSSKKYGGSGNRTGGYDVHIKSADGRYGDLGWVSLSQISGYVTGTKGITNPVEIARVDELGKELRIKRGGKRYIVARDKQVHSAYYIIVRCCRVRTESGRIVRHIIL